MKDEISYPDLSDLEKTNKIAESLFGTEEDKTQAKPTIENCLKLISIEKNNFICLKEGGKIIAWSVVLPTSLEEMENFLTGKINERRLFEISMSKPSFEALYLTAVVVLPEYRKKGIGSSLMEKQIKYFKEKYGIKELYALTLTKEGKKLIGKIERDLNTKISSLSRV